MKKNIIVAGIILALFACDKDETNPEQSITSNNQTTNTTVDTSAYFNNYRFSDDMVLCEPFYKDNEINSYAILSVVSKPCSKLSSKLDGYFKFWSDPQVGVYTIVGKAGEVPIANNIGPTSFSMVFYNHGESMLSSTGGTISLSKNKADTTLFDLNWKNVDMTYEHNDSTIQFSGNLSGLEKK